MSGTKVYLFQCGNTERYALSVDSTGCNIPPGSAAWLLRGDFSKIKIPEFAEPMREVVRKGYCLLVINSD
jgi:hypothetical protein